MSNSSSESPPTSQSQDFPVVHGLQHVLSEHVRPFVPIRRQDISMLKRVEEGVGESLSYPDFLKPQPVLDDSQDIMKRKDIREITLEPMSSLPSPPVSSPTSLSAAVDDDESYFLSHPSSPIRHSLGLLSPEVPSQQPQDNDDQQRSSLEHPSFASLSSPMDSRTDAMTVDPPSPSFDSLVADALNANKQRIRSRSPVSSHSRPSHIRNLDSQISISPSSSNNSYGSHDSVEKQLTQSTDIDQDVDLPNDLPPPEPVRSDLRTISIARNFTNEPSSIPAQRQAWYGTRPPRRSSLAAALGTRIDSEVRGTTKLRVSHSTPSRLDEAAVYTLPENTFRSGTLQITPSLNDEEPRTYSQSQVPSPSQPQSQMQAQTQSQSQTQSETQESSFEYGSYPPLQTQAPYQSQSFSP
ncbi:hypothetical protein DXG01_003112 [Tephrocybe rancida]|nr:hypothetical protein DXG01_003112 [Tephrocybe rancida]